MRFAHFADVHIGSWREPKLTSKSTEAFVKAVHLCKEKQVDFVVISGDFFDTAIPPIQLLKEVVIAMRTLQQANIPIYLIPGSHDFSSSGKSMIDVLESAGFCHNVMRGTIDDNQIFLRFTEDKKTGAKLTGIIGKKGMLDKHYYSNLTLTHLEAEQGTKLFLFHTAITEFKPKSLEKMDSVPLSFFPKNFSYYAGGHIHQPFQHSQEHYPLITMPGPLFPASFSELEKLKQGGFYIVDIIENKTSYEFIPIILHPILSFTIQADGKTPEQLLSDTLLTLKAENLENAIVTLRFKGTLISGKPSSINFNNLFSQCEEQNVYLMLKNTAKLFSEEFKEIKYPNESVELIEEKVLSEHLGQSNLFSLEEEKELATNLLLTLSTEKQEGETVTTFESRLKKDIESILNITL